MLSASSLNSGGAGKAPKVLIIGAGPTGLVLGLSLLRNGVPVRIVDKRLSSTLGQRGAGITPRSMELFQFLGVADHIIRRGIPLSPLLSYKMPEGREVLKEFELVPKTEPTSDKPYTGFWCLGQDKLIPILEAEIAKYGCNVELGVELLSLSQLADSSRVAVKLLRKSGNNLDEEDATYEYVAGADGAKSAVRKQLGLPLVGQTVEEKFISADLKIEGLRHDRWHVWGTMGDGVSLRPTEDIEVFNLVFGGTKLGDFSKILASDETFKEYLMNKMGDRDDIKIKEIDSIGSYPTNIRMVETFVKRRVFLLGDAAHIHSPAGAQGMNTGVQDAFNIGWKLALVLHNRAPRSLLDSYTEERLPVVSEMLNLTTFFLQRPVRQPESADRGWTRTQSVLQFGVNYRESSIVLEESLAMEGDTPVGGSKFAHTGDHDALAKGAKSSSSAYFPDPSGVLRAGDRAPDASGLAPVGPGEEGPTRMFDLFSPTRHTVLIFGDHRSDEMRSILTKYPKDLVRVVVITTASKGLDLPKLDEWGCDLFTDREGNAHRDYLKGSTGRAVFVIRPDGVIGAKLRCVDGVRRYLGGILGVNSTDF